MWKIVQKIISPTADLLQIASFFGLTPAIVIATTIAVIGWASNIPIYYIAVGIILVFASVTYLSRGFIARVGTMSLNDGARIAYERLRGTIWADAAENLRIDPTPDGILDYIATGITQKISIFGKFPPSTHLERLPDLLVKSGSIEGGGRLLQLRDQHRSQIIGLTIRKSDLKKAIRLMKAAGNMLVE